MGMVTMVMAVALLHHVTCKLSMAIILLILVTDPTAKSHNVYAAAHINIWEQGLAAINSVDVNRHLSRRRHRHDNGSHVTCQPTAALERKLVNTVCKLILQLVTHHGAVAIELSKATVKTNAKKACKKARTWYPVAAHYQAFWWQNNTQVPQTNRKLQP